MLRLILPLTLSALIWLHVFIGMRIYLALREYFLRAKIKPIKNKIITMLLLHGDKALAERTISTLDKIKNINKLNEIHANISAILIKEKNNVTQPR
jgi:hypothetical protein